MDLNLALKQLVAALCTYEAVSIWVHRTPTISAISWRWKPVGIAILVGLAWHLWHPPLTEPPVRVKLSA